MVESVPTYDGVCLGVRNPIQIGSTVIEDGRVLSDGVPMCRGMYFEQARRLDVQSPLN